VALGAGFADLSYSTRRFTGNILRSRRLRPEWAFMYFVTGLVPYRRHGASVCVAIPTSVSYNNPGKTVGPIAEIGYKPTKERHSVGK
jgi:hypothetical protein